jgi:hypothetical protein
MNTKGLTRCFGLLLVASVSLFFIQSANATLLFSEAFNYTAGTTLHQGPWSAGSSPGLTIGSGNLTYANGGFALVDLGGKELSILNGSATSGIATFANQTSGQIFYSFLLNVTTVDSGNQYFTAMNPGTTAPSGSADALGTYNWSTGAIGMRAAPASTVTDSILTLGQTYFVVDEYNFDTKVATLYLNPTPGGSQPAATLTISSTSATAIDNVGFKAQTGSGAYLVDNLRVGTTWEDVTPGVAVPEPSAFALMGFGCLSLIATVIRRRRS